MKEAEFPYIPLDTRVMIAMKGLPCTGKSEIAALMGAWAGCPVVYIDDPLNTLSLEKGYTSQFGPFDSGEELMPSAEEADRLHRLAFDALCKSAFRHLYFHNGQCVIIKSRLCSTFELDRLLQLSRELPDGIFQKTTIILIIECHIKNEYRLYTRLEELADDRKEEWYKARSRLDFEKARDDWLHDDQPHTWNLHLTNLINAHERPARVIRLVLDPFDDLNLSLHLMSGDLTPTFRDAFRYLLTTQHSYAAQQEEEVDWIGEEIISNRYELVQFRKLQCYLVEQELKRAHNSGQKSKYLCPTSRLGKCCVFKTYTKGEEDDDHSYNCEVCNEPVVSARYTCHFCFLTLHKSCAEHQGITFPVDFASNSWLRYYPKYCDDYLQRTYACKSCKKRGKHFSKGCNACLFQTHLKCRKFPTIIKHDCHQEHFLSLQVGESSWSSRCKACKFGMYEGRYGCYVCGLRFCLGCVLRPGKLEHSHGGHEHVLELVYSRGGMEPKEDYWCDVCYEDLDPQNWFYSCSDCPCYEAHPECIMPVWPKL